MNRHPKKKPPSDQNLPQKRVRSKPIHKYFSRVFSVCTGHTIKRSCKHLRACSLGQVKGTPESVIRAHPQLWALFSVYSKGMQAVFGIFNRPREKHKSQTQDICPFLYKPIAKRVIRYVCGKYASSSTSTIFTSAISAFCLSVIMSAQQEKIVTVSLLPSADVL